MEEEPKREEEVAAGFGRGGESWAGAGVEG